MPAISFPASTYPSKFTESGGRVVNLYAEKLQDGRVCHRTVPGLRELVTIAGYQNCRGLIYIGSTLLAVLNDRVFSLVSAGGGVYTVTNLGALPGANPVFLARNNKTPTPDIVAVTDSTAYELSLSGAPVSYSDADVGSPNAVDFQGGYFVFTYGDGKMQASGLNDIAINTLDFAYAERRPDTLHRPFALGDTLYAIGASTIECWKIDPNNEVGFPFSYVTTLERGVTGPQAIAGNEAAWTNTGIFVGNDNIVYKLSGYQIERISNHSIERLIEKYADHAGIRCFVYAFSGHPCWVLASDSWTLVYDLGTGAWHERKSYGLDTWRARTSVYAFDQWVCGDSLSGSLFVVDEDYHKEGTSPLVWELVGTPATAFPDKAAVTRADVDAVVGVGVASGANPVETDPRMSISWSHDGGVVFGSPVLRTIGAQGDYKQEIRVNRLGTSSAYGFRLKLSGSDPVHTSIFGANIEVQPRS